jgi:uncharacterized membrane protein
MPHATASSRQQFSGESPEMIAEQPRQHWKVYERTKSPGRRQCRAMQDTKPIIPKRRLLRLYFRRFVQYFLHGVLVVAPLAITLAALGWMFNFVDSLLRPYLDIPGLGFVTVVAIVVFAGWISSFFVIEQVIGLFDEWLERMPGVNLVYSPVRGFLRALVGRKRRFNRTVLANIFSEGVWVVGFLTDEDLQRFELGKEHVAVYVPQAYNVAGQLYLVPRERVRLLDSLSAGDAMRYAISGGAVEPQSNGITPAPLP